VLFSPDGLLTAASGSPFNAQGLGPFGSEFSPTSPTELFVSNAHDGAGNGTVSAFSDNFGTLSSIGASPFHNNQTAPCWVEISADGRWLFAVNTASASVSSYFIGADGSLALAGSTPLPAAGLNGAEDARLAPDGQTLWIVVAGANSLVAFSVQGGSLLPLPQSLTAGPAGATPSGIVVI
jgi:6-phosphogluconolactonase (cycloisomerase 2 family)